MRRESLLQFFRAVFCRGGFGFPVAVHDRVRGQTVYVLGWLGFGRSLSCARFFSYWPTAKWRIFADRKNIRCHNGFRLKTVRWDEVASYYLERHHPHERSRSQLIFFNARHEILLQIPIAGNSTPQALGQWSELWQFVDGQLDGKKIDAPYISFEPAEMVARSLDVDWKSKTVAWKIARMVGLVCYALFWCSISMALMFAVSVYYPAKPLSGVGSVLMLLAMCSMFWGPMLPYVVYIKVKQRKIAREWKTRDKIE